jgi:hypothetical protein
VGIVPLRLTILGEADGQTYAVERNGQFFVRSDTGWVPVIEVPLEITRATVLRNPRARWTRESVIVAIQEFHRRYGRPPASTDWNVAHAKALGHPEKVERFYADNCYPHANVVYGGKYGLFDSWADAIEAAGLPRPAPGRYETATRSYYAKSPSKRECVDCGAETSGTRCRRCHSGYASRVHWDAVRS